MNKVYFLYTLKTIRSIFLTLSNFRIVMLCEDQCEIFFNVYVILLLLMWLMSAGFFFPLCIPRCTLYIAQTPLFANCYDVRSLSICILSINTISREFSSPSSILIKNHDGKRWLVTSSLFPLTFITLVGFTCMIHVHFEVTTIINVKHSSIVQLLLFLA